MKTVGDMVIYLLVTAAMQNVVLTTGLGSSSLARLMRRPRQRRTFGTLLIVFSVVTTALFFPLDRLLPTEWQFRLMRPLLVVVITAVVYVATVLAARRWFADWYRRVNRFLPLAAFNTIVIGAALVINYQFSASFFPALGIALGSALGFMFLSSMVTEAMERMDNPDTPNAFRGLPGTLVYLGLLALALMGFRPVLNLI